MVQKMTAVWLIVLTVLICAIIPVYMIWLTTIPHETKLLIGLDMLIDNSNSLLLK